MFIIKKLTDKTFSISMNELNLSVKNIEEDEKGR